MKKEHRTNRRYSAEFKIRVILDMRTNHLGYNETVYKFNEAGKNFHVTQIYNKIRKIANQ